MALYTFILDHGGGTYISQQEGTDLEAAIRAWSGAPALDIGIKLNRQDQAQFKASLTAQNATSLAGARNVWCLSTIVRGELALIHVVLTEG